MSWLTYRKKHRRCYKNPMSYRVGRKKGKLMIRSMSKGSNGSMIEEST